MNLRKMNAHNQPGESVARFKVSPTAETHFSWLRTRMSTERTLMSWIRTGTSLIAFGFTLFQFLDRFNKTPGITPADYPRAPQILGLALIGTGILGLSVAAYQYRQLLHYLWSEEFEAASGGGEHWQTPVYWIALLLIVVGAFAFVAVLLRFH